MFMFSLSAINKNEFELKGPNTDGRLWLPRRTKMPLIEIQMNKYAAYRTNDLFSKHDCFKTIFFLQKTKNKQNGNMIFVHVFTVRQDVDGADCRMGAVFQAVSGFLQPNRLLQYRSGL